MEDTRISFETAKLAKEKGFKIPTKVMYKGNEKSYGHNNEWGIDEKRLDGEFPYTNQQWYSIPAQSLLQKWLREKHDIHFEIKPIFEVNEIRPYHISISKNLSGKNFNYKIIGTRETYEEALEIGLQEALKLIK